VAVTQQMDSEEMEWLLEGATPQMKRRAEAINQLREHTGCSQNDAVRALNATGPMDDNVELARRILPKVCSDSHRRRIAARRRQQDDAADIDFRAGDEVKVRGLQKQPELNGALGVVRGLNAKTGRHMVLLERTGSTVNIKAVNLEPLDDGGLEDDVDDDSDDDSRGSSVSVMGRSEDDNDEGEEDGAEEEQEIQGPVQSLLRPEPEGAVPEANSAAGGVAEWDERQVCDWAARLGLGDAVVAALRDVRNVLPCPSPRSRPSEDGARVSALLVYNI
jgi:hypothetical protein